MCLTGIPEWEPGRISYDEKDRGDINDMTSGQVFCIFMIGTGLVLLVIVIMSLAKRRMTEPFCLAWGFFALLLLLAGSLLHPTELDRYISVTGILLILFLFYSMLISAYALSRALSVLIRKNRELAVQVSILNAEAERLSRELEAFPCRTEGDSAGCSRAGEKAGRSRAGEAGCSVAGEEVGNSRAEQNPAHCGAGEEETENSGRREEAAGRCRAGEEAGCCATREAGS